MTKRFTFPVFRTYHVDATGGNDSYPGTAHYPLKTLAAVNALRLAPGDRVLLKRGEIFKGGSLTMSYSGKFNKPIYFGAYGSGANPIIDPTTEFNDFVLDAGAVWRRADVNYVLQVFQDGNRMIYSADRASMVVGSWAKAAGILYVWCTDGADPNVNHVIDIVEPANNVAVRFNGKSYITFDHIDVTKTCISAYVADVVGSHHITIQNCDVGWSGIRSILIGTDTGLGYTYPTDVLIDRVVGHDDLDVSFWVGHCSRVVVRNCEAYNYGADLSPRAKNYPSATHYPNGFLISAEAQNCVIQDCYAHNGYATAILDELSLGLKSSNSIIERNMVDVTGTALTGICVESISPLVRNNVILAGTGMAIQCNNTPTAPKFYNNTLYSAINANHSIYCGSGSNIEVKGNIIIRSGASNRFISVPIAAQVGFVADNNDYYQSAGTPRWFWGPTEYVTLATWKAGSGKDASAIDTDPVLVTPYTNFHLQAASPCRGAGIASLVLDDKDQVSRGAAVDIGAYEYV